MSTKMLEQAELKAAVVADQHTLGFYMLAFSKMPDKQGDVIAPGAADEWLQEFYAAGQPLPISFTHSAVTDAGDPFNIIGYAPADPQHVFKDAHGIKVIANLDTASNPTAAQVYTLAKRGIVTGASVAYFTTQVGQTLQKDGSTLITKIEDIIECGPCLDPANEDAFIFAVKAMEKAYAQEPLPSTTQALKAHLEAAAPGGHGVAAGSVDKEPPAFLPNTHKRLHAAGNAGHSHPGAGYSAQTKAASLDESAWDGNVALGACNSAADYRSICAGERSLGTSDERQHWALPHHYLGKLANHAGVIAARQRFDQTQGLTNSAEARRHLFEVHRLPTDATKASGAELQLSSLEFVEAVVVSMKAGRVISAANMAKLRAAQEVINELLAFGETEIAAPKQKADANGEEPQANPDEHGPDAELRRQLAAFIA